MRKKILLSRIIKVKQVKRWWNYLFDAGPIITSIAAIVGVVYAVYNVDRTLDLQRESKAVELFKEYSDRVEKNLNFTDPSFTNDSTNWNDSYIIFAQYCLFISESIYNLSDGNVAWENTLKNHVLYPHIYFYEKNGSMDDSYSSKFRSFYYEVQKEFLKNKK
jgi:hypothetical protein